MLPGALPERGQLTQPLTEACSLGLQDRGNTSFSPQQGLLGLGSELTLNVIKPALHQQLDGILGSADLGQHD